MLNKALQHIGQLFSRAFVVLLRKSISQNHHLKAVSVRYPLN